MSWLCKGYVSAEVVDTAPYSAGSRSDATALTEFQRFRVDTGVCFSRHRIDTMSKFTSFPERALELVSSVGDNIKQHVPKAGQWLETGVKLGALKTGARTAGGFIRRNPVIAVAAVAGAGLLWYAAARRKAKQQAEGDPIEGSARRIDARRADSNGSASRRKSGTRKAASEETATE